MDLRVGPSSPACSICLRKPLVAREVLPYLRGVPSNTCHRKLVTELSRCHIHGALKTEEIDNAILIEIQESGNGYTLFKFGDREWYEAPRGYGRSAVKTKSIIHAEPDRIVTDAAPVLCSLSTSNCLSSPWAYQTASICGGTLDSFRNENMAELWAHSCGAEKSPDLSLRFVRPCSFPVIPIIRGVRGNSAAKCLCPSAMPTGTTQLLPAYVNFKDVSSQVTSEGPFEVRTAKVSTLRRVDKKPRARHKKPVRDLFEINSFKIYESIFCYLFVDSGDAFARWKAIPKKKYMELSGVLNAIAVGLAGSGLALMLFVASRMLCLNATLDNIKMMSLLYGAGLIWLSSALQTFGSKFRFMAEREERTKSQRKKHFTMLKRELHSLMFKLCTMVMLLVVTLA